MLQPLEWSGDRNVQITAMIDFETFLKDSNLLTEKVDGYARVLTSQSEDLNGLITRLEGLFELIARSDNLVKIIHDYSAGFKRDIVMFKNDLTEQETIVRELTDRLNAVSERLKLIDTIFGDVLKDSGQFVASAQALVYLAKNAEIRAFKAKADGRGLAVIAKETLALARQTQEPFRDLSRLLDDLKEIAQPVIRELETVLEVSSRSQDLLARTFASLQLIDETNNVLQKIIAGVEENTAAYDQLQKTVSEGVAVLNDRLLTALQTVDDLSVRSSEIRSLAHIMRVLNRTTGSSVHQELQLRFLMEKSQKILNTFTVGREPPLFPETVQKSIAEILQRIHNLGAVMGELTKYDEHLDTGMTSVTTLEAQIEAYERDTRSIFQRLNAVSARLITECANMEQLLDRSDKIFGRIKTLTVFARIEEGRCTAGRRPVIAPVVAEFFRLEQETERALANIRPRFTKLLSLMQELSRDTRLDKAMPVKTPDYGKIKLYLNDIVRVSSEEDATTVDIRQQADRLTASNSMLYRHWQDYEGALARVLHARRGFDEHIKTPPAAPAVQPERITVSCILSNDPLTLRPDLKTDSTSHYVVMNFSEGLFEFGFEADPLPAVCEECDISADSTQYTFRIRDGIRFQNGRRLRIEDVKEGFLRALAGPNAHLFEMIKGSREYQAGKNREAAAIRILNNRTLQVVLEYPFLPILANLGTNVADPYLPDNPPVGLGPFHLAEWRRGEEVRMTVNDNYYQGRSAIDEVRFRILGDGEAAYEEFRQGKLDIYKPGTTQLVKARHEFPQLLHTLPELSVHFMTINCRRPPFDNKHVRKALSFAIDTRRMVRDCMNGDGVPAKGIFPPTLKAHNAKLEGYPYSASRARAALAEAGFPNGLPDTYPMEVSDSPVSVRRAEYIQQSLREVGINIEIKSMPWTQLIERTYAGKHMLTMSGWISDNGDPDNFLYPLFHSRSFGRTGNTFFYADPQVDRDLDDARRIRNTNQRIQVYRRIEERIMDDAPGVFLYHSLQYFLIQERIRGFEPHPLGLLRFKYLGGSGGTDSAALPMVAGGLVFAES